MGAPEKLKRRLLPAFEYALPDIRTLTTSIMTQRADTWQATMTDLLRKLNVRKSGTGPSGNDRKQLLKQSADDAKSIAATWKRDIESAIDQIFDANPLATRNEFIRELTSWADRRSVWKDLQITNNNQSTARTFAQKRFREENKATATFKFRGPPAKESECQKLERAGVVDQNFVESHPTPVHLNCPHFWEEQEITVTATSVWTGG